MQTRTITHTIVTIMMSTALMVMLMIVTMTSANIAHVSMYTPIMTMSMTRVMVEVHGDGGNVCGM